MATRRRPTRSGPWEPPLLEAKLNRPQAGPALERPRLARALDEHAHRPLTLVVADAGFGKTTLLAAWVRTLSRPVVWYSLMPSDDDPIVFGRYLLQGFRRESPRFGSGFQRALEEARPGGRTAEMLGGTLAQELAGLKGGPWVLVLDDFHEVATNAQVVELVGSLVRQLPDAIRLVVASRTLPPLPVERMRARSELFELHSSHLRFTRDELAALFGEVYQRPLEPSELVALEEATLGWPTAVHLVHESLRRADHVALTEVLAQFRASNLELHEYLSAEVYARLDESSRRLLERTAALSRFDATLAARMAALPDARGTLEALARRGLLRAFGAGAQTTWECHDLVRRFIREELEARDGEAGRRLLEGETAEVLAARGEPERALRHFLAAGRAADAASLVRDLAPGLLRQGRAEALRGYLTDLPERLVQSDAALAIALADAQQALGAWDEAEARYGAVLERCRELGARELEARALIGLGKLLTLRGRHEQVLGMAERGLAASRGLPSDLKAHLLRLKAGAHFYLGQHGAAVDALGQARALLEGAEPDALVPIVHNLAIAYGAQGRFREASDEFRAALATVRGSASPRAPLYLSNLAFLLAELGDLAEARKAAEEGLVAAQRFANRAQETLCQQALAQILAESGDFDGALAALRRAEELNGELRMEVIAADLLGLRGRIFLGRGEYRRAVEFVGAAIERLQSRPDEPRLTEFRATLGWCELRAGRVRVARDALAALVGPADAAENEYQQTRVHYWLAEALLALDETAEVDAHLRTALRKARERGYIHFLRGQAREEPAPLLHALARGIELDTVAAALVDAGPAVESPLLALLPRAPAAVAEAAITVLGEIGGEHAARTLPRLAQSRRALRPAVRVTMRHVDSRLARGAVAAGAPRLVLWGPPQLRIGDETVPASAWRAQRAFHLLVFLALHPRGASRDELLERFWPGRQLAAGRKNFHPTLSYIRSVMPSADEPAILRESEIYRLHPDYPLTCDHWEFERAESEARASTVPRVRRAALERAVAVAQGAFLQGLYLDWADELQARSRDRLEKILLQLAPLAAAAGDLDAALLHFRRASEIDAYRESTRLAIVECMMRLGNRRGALVEYEKLRALLRSELGVEPLPETEEAVQRLLAGEHVHPWAGPSPGAQAQDTQGVARSGQVRLKSARGGSPR